MAKKIDSFIRDETNLFTNKICIFLLGNNTLLCLIVDLPSKQLKKKKILN